MLIWGHGATRERNAREDARRGASTRSFAHQPTSGRWSLSASIAAAPTERCGAERLRAVASYRAQTRAYEGQRSQVTRRRLLWNGGGWGCTNTKRED